MPSETPNKSALWTSAPTVMKWTHCLQPRWPTRPNQTTIKQCIHVFSARKTNTCNWYMADDSYRGKNETSLAIEELEVRLILGSEGETRDRLENPASALFVDVFASAIHKTVRACLDKCWWVLYRRRLSKRNSRRLWTCSIDRSPTAWAVGNVAANFSGPPWFYLLVFWTFYRC